MKTFLLTAAISTFASSLFAQGQGGSSGNPFAGLQIELDRIQWTYRTDTPSMTPDEAHQLAGRLSQMSGVELQYDSSRDEDGRMMYGAANDRSTLLDINLRSRGFLFNAGYGDMRGEEDTPRLPKNKKRILGKATQHLRTLGLLPEPKDMFVEHIGGLNMSVVREDGSTSDYRKLVSVRLGRTTDIQNTQGPGSRILVQLGTAGRLRGMVFEWEHFASQQLEDHEKIPAAEVKRLSMLRMNDVTRNALRKRITEVDVVFFDDGYGVLEPAIHVVATIVLQDNEGNKFTNPFDFYVPVPTAPKGYYPFLEDQGIPAPDAD